jgi:hypothetical protein
MYTESPQEFCASQHFGFLKQFVNRFTNTLTFEYNIYIAPAILSHITSKILTVIML